MARFWFGDSDDYSVSVSPVDGTLKMRPSTRKYYDAEVGGTQYTDLLLAGVTPVSSVSSDGSPIRFQGPDNVAAMWESANEGPRVLVVSADARAGIDALVATAVAAAASINREAANGVAGLDAGGKLYDARIPATVVKYTDGSAFADIGKYAGVDPTGVTECAAAINTALTTIAAAGARAYGKGTFKIASTVTIASDADLGDATFNYTAGSGLAVRVGTTTSGAFITGIRVVVPQLIAVAKTNIGWAQVAGTTGLEISNLLASVIEVPLVRNFETGMRNYGKGKGNVHNTHLLGHLDNNKINQMCSADATGWSNQNLYLGGQFSHNGGEGAAVSGVRHIEMAVCTNAVNNSRWINPSLEGDTPEFHAIIAGTDNVIAGGRWEVTGGGRVKWASDASANIIDGGYNSHLLVETFAAGAAGSNNIESVSRLYRTGSGGTKGVAVYENQSSSANPSLMFMEAGARIAGANPATAYAVALGAQTSGFKQAADAYDRLQIDAILGRILLGFGTAAPAISLGICFDTPEGAVTAPVGSVRLRSNGGAGTTLYVKESGTGNTGWVAK